MEYNGITLVWEDHESTKGDCISLSPNFMWLVDKKDTDGTGLAYGIVHRDPEIWGDDKIRWSVRPFGGNDTVCLSFEDGKK